MVTILTGKHLLKRTRSRKANYAGDHGILCSYIQIAQYYQEHGYFEEAFEYFKKAGKKGLTFGYTEFARANPEEGFEILKSIPLAFREATLCQRSGGKIQSTFYYFIQYYGTKLLNHFKSMF
jgi:hypothetical protein